MNFLDAIAISLWIAWWVYLIMFINWGCSWMRRWNWLVDKIEDERIAAKQYKHLEEWQLRLSATIGE